MEESTVPKEVQNELPDSTGTRSSSSSSSGSALEEPETPKPKPTPKRRTATIAVITLVCILSLLAAIVTGAILATTQASSTTTTTTTTTSEIEFGVPAWPESVASADWITWSTHTLALAGDSEPIEVDLPNLCDSQGERNWNTTLEDSECLRLVETLGLPIEAKIIEKEYGVPWVYAGIEVKCRRSDFNAYTKCLFTDGHLCYNFQRPPLQRPPFTVTHCQYQVQIYQEDRTCKYYKPEGGYLICHMSLQEMRDYQWDGVIDCESFSILWFGIQANLTDAGLLEERDIVC